MTSALKRLTRHMDEEEAILSRLLDPFNYVDLRTGFECCAIMHPFLTENADFETLTKQVTKRFIAGEPSDAVDLVSRLAACVDRGEPMDPTCMENENDAFVAVLFYAHLEELAPIPDFPSCLDLHRTAAEQRAIARNLAKDWRRSRGNPGKASLARIDAFLLGLSYVQWSRGGSLALPSNENVDNMPTALFLLARRGVNQVVAAMRYAQSLKPSRHHHIPDFLAKLAGLTDRTLLDRLRPVAREFV